MDLHGAEIFAICDRAEATGEASCEALAGEVIRGWKEFLCVRGVGLHFIAPSDEKQAGGLKSLFACGAVGGRVAIRVVPWERGDLGGCLGNDFGRRQRQFGQGGETPEGCCSCSPRRRLHGRVALRERNAGKIMVIWEEFRTVSFPRVRVVVSPDLPEVISRQARIRPLMCIQLEVRTQTRHDIKSSSRRRARRGVVPVFCALSCREDLSPLLIRPHLFKAHP
ncbi:unnamed protein product [Chondrus crispus]|uniref:Uncharacterized protein n=1 Tax=Chondrus crispus TaxID=2769 RepID=R7QTZ7_CHOCR|nr:unnamed protein product [Chondrus crispus]CDF40961.1 unnamed protein product [Chondrus crispus]|eukprot:XP_005711255.1 unnamed protein product [Chondrus crispus]